MRDLYSAFSLPLITTAPYPRKNAAVLTEGWFTQRGGEIRCRDRHWMYRDETGDYFNRSLLEDRGGWILSPCLSHILQLRRCTKMRSSEMETQAAGPCRQHAWQSPATQLCDSAAVNWTVHGSVPYPSYPCQLWSWLKHEGWSMLPYPRGDLVQKYPCRKEIYIFCYYSLLALVSVCWLTIRKQKREEKPEKRELTVSSVQEEVSCTHTKLKV